MRGRGPDSSGVFTGLVQTVGSIGEVEARGSGIRLIVEASGWDHRPGLGESISVAGCCLTLAAVSDGRMRFDVVQETLEKTTLGGFRGGSRVNLERSLRVGDLMGGHVVQGHVDGVGEVERVERSGGDYKVWVRPPRDLMRYMVPRGSICIDGVSLTLASVDPTAGVVMVALIPTTLEVTTLGSLASGDRVNIEADAMAKTMVHYLEHFAGERQERSV
jgi:riboflavin synthase